MEEIMKYDILIKINKQNEIILVNSSAFIKNAEEYITIDSGIGEKYAHAQGNYFEKDICDAYGRYNYKYENEQVIEVEHGEYIPEVSITPLEQVQADVEFLKLISGVM